MVRLDCRAVYTELSLIVRRYTEQQECGFMVCANERTKIMESQLEETKQKIKELLVKNGFPEFGGVSIDTDKINVVSKRDDMPEGEGIYWTIRRRSGQRWMLSDKNKPNYFANEEKMLEFIGNTLRELVSSSG